MNIKPYILMNNYTLLIALLFFSLISKSQYSEEKKIDIKTNNKDRIYCIHTDKNEPLILKEAKKEKGNKLNWEIEFYNADLSLIKSAKFYLPGFKPWIIHCDNDNLFHIISLAGSKAHLVTIDKTTLTSTSFDFKISYPFKPSVKALGDFIYMSSGRQCYVVNCKTGDKKEIDDFIPLKELKNIKLSTVKKSKKHNSIFFYFLDKKDTYLIKINKEGKKTDFINLTEDTDDIVWHIETIQNSKNEFIFSGQITRKKGFLIGKIENNKAKTIKSYLLKDVNFFSFPLKIKKIELNDFSLNKLVEVNDGYVLPISFYAVNSRQESSSSLSKTTGYSFLHAEFLKLDTNANLLSSYSIPLSRGASLGKIESEIFMYNSESFLHSVDIKTNIITINSFDKQSQNLSSNEINLNSENLNLSKNYYHHFDEIFDLNNGYFLVSANYVNLLNESHFLLSKVKLE